MGFNIKEVVLNINNKIYTYYASEIEVINDEQIRLMYKGPLNETSVDIGIISIKYGVSNWEFTTIIRDFKRMFLLKSYEIINISTIEQLQSLENGYIYQLTNDIDATGFNWLPYDFSGFIFGNGYEIRNLHIKNIYEYKGYHYVGLFSNFTGIIEHLGLSNISIDVSCEKAAFIGGLAGRSYYSRIEDVYIDKGSIKVKTNNELSIGGLIGKLDFSSLNNNFVKEVNLMVDNENMVVMGGLVGKSYNNLISNSYTNSSKILGSDGFIGGFIGQSNNEEIMNSYVTNTEIKIINGTENQTNSIGGFIGNSIGNSNNLVLNNNYIEDINIIVEGNIAANIGGLIGYDNLSTIDNCKTNTTTITVKSNSIIVLGGLVGQKNRGIINLSFSNNAYISVKELEYARVGGLVGIGKDFTVKESYINELEIIVSVQGLQNNNYIGGLICQSEDSEIINSYVDNSYIYSYSINKTSIGGLVGYADFNTIKSSFVKDITTNATSVQSYIYSGGLVGESVRSTINDSSVFSTTSIKITHFYSYDALGFIVGHRYLGSINNCFVDNNVYLYRNGVLV